MKIILVEKYTPRKTSVLFPEKLNVFPKRSWGKHLHLRETKQMLPGEAVIKCFII